MAFFRGYDRVVGGHFRRKGRGGAPFFSQETETIDILGNFGHFVAQK
jgi:hypothetical protein